jgi:hypothetical protein
MGKLTPFPGPGSKEVLTPKKSAVKQMPAKVSSSSSSSSSSDGAAPPLALRTPPHPKFSLGKSVDEHQRAFKQQSLEKVKRVRVQIQQSSKLTSTLKDSLKAGSSTCKRAKEMLGESCSTKRHPPPLRSALLAHHMHHAHPLQPHGPGRREEHY